MQRDNNGSKTLRSQQQISVYQRDAPFAKNFQHDAGELTFTHFSEPVLKGKFSNII